MEDLSESRKHEILQYPWTGKREMAPKMDDVAAQFSSQELDERYKRIKAELDEEFFRLKMRCRSNEIRFFFGRWNNYFESKGIEKEQVPRSYGFMAPPVYQPWNFFRDIRLDLVKAEKEEAEKLLLGGVCEQPRPALPKARRIRDPPPRVSRRSSQVSQPTYLRHRFLPRSRKQSSSRRQR